MIQIRNLRKSFGGRVVLDGVSLDILAGRVTAILGPNASGKSTLMKCVLGLVNPDGGEIMVDGDAATGRWQYRSNVGYMPQIARFPENLTVDELFAMLRDLRDDVRDVDIELFARFQLGDIGRQRLGALSGGTRQKILAAVAFLFNPRVLILDEPTVGLDPVATTTLKDKIRKERSAGRTILLSSHLVNEVEEIADHVIYILDGRALFDGSMSDIKQETDEIRLDRALVRLMERAAEGTHGSHR